MQDFNFVAWLLMAGCTFALAFWIARLCLAGVVRMLGNHDDQRLNR